MTFSYPIGFMGEIYFVVLYIMVSHIDQVRYISAISYRILRYPIQYLP